MRLKNRLILIAALMCCLFSLFAEPSAHRKVEDLKGELGLGESLSIAEENKCYLYIVHHGDTEYTVQKRLQGWVDTSLNADGKKQMQELAQQLSSLKIDAIYTSSLNRAIESAEILSETLESPVIIDSALRGESHGNLEGMLSEEYQKDSHYLQYKALSSEEKIFFSVGEGGLSKAEVARMAIPAINEICRKHPGQNVVIVTHGGVLKLIAYLLGENPSEQIPHGEMLLIEGDGTTLRPLG